VKSFVRDGYEWAWHNLNPRLGIDYNIEGCTTRLTALGIQLSSAGIGDFWDQGRRGGAQLAGRGAGDRPRCHP